MIIEISKFFLEISNHLRTKNRFSLPADCEAKVVTFCHYYINNLTEITVGTEYWRSRIWGVNQTKNFIHQEMGAPPPQFAGSGRINPEGIPYLYGASDSQTAISEVRPWVGANISLVKFKVIRNLKLVDLTKKPRDSFNSNDHEEHEIFTGLQLAVNTTFMDKLFFSAPAHENDKLAYITSQFISERFKALGADGIIYHSVLNEGGLNVCLFDPESAKINHDIRKKTVQSVKFEVIKA